MGLHTTLLFVLILTSTTLFGQEVDTDKLFYQAVYAEQIDGDLDKARSLYQQIIKANPDDRTIMAKTLYRLGLITEKDGAKKALGYYTKVVEEYPEQKDLIQLVQSRVDKLEDANTFIDERDGHKYKYVQIGKQIWMAENLAYMPHVNPVKKQEYGIWVYDYNGDNVAEAKATENYQKYGCLYDWTMAMNIEPKYLDEVWGGDPENHQGICPPGWRMPSKNDWEKMEKHLGMPDSLIKERYYRSGHINHGIRNDRLPPVGQSLKSTNDWLSDGDGNNSSGFNALPSGIRIEAFSDQFTSIGYITNFWTSNFADIIESLEGESTNPSSWNRQLFGLTTTYRNINDIWSETSARKHGFSVRCIKSRYKNPPDSSPEFIKKVKAQGNYTSEKYIQSGSPISLSVIWKTKNKGNLSSINAHENLVFFEGRDSLLYAYDINTGQEVWKKNYYCGLSVNPLIIEDNTLYKTVQNGVIAIQATDGSLIWNYTIPGGPGFIAEAKDILLYANWRPQNLTKSIHAIDKKSGSELWNKQIAYEYISSLPTIDNELIFLPVSTGKYGNSFCQAIDLKTRKIKWEFKVNQSIKCTPVATSDVTIVGSRDQYIYAIDNNTGKEIWKYFIGIQLFDSPTIHNGMVFINGKNSFYSFDLLTGDINWEVFSGKHMASAMSTAFNNQVIVGLGNGQVFGLDTQTGEMLWQSEVGNALTTKPLVHNDKLVLGTWDGQLIVLNLPKIGQN